MEKFETIEDEFIYYATKALAANEAGDRTTCLMYLKIAVDLLEKIEGKNLDDLINEIEVLKQK